MDTILKMSILKSSYFWHGTYEKFIKSEKDILIVNHEYLFIIIIIIIIIWQ